MRDICMSSMYCKLMSIYDNVKHCPYMSSLMTKPTWLCAQQRLRSVWSSAWTFAKSVESLCCPHEETLAIHWAHSEDSDQTGWMPRLVWVFAGRTHHFVGFVRLPVTRHQQSLATTCIKWARPWENVSYVICEQQRRRSAYTSAQSDQRLCCSLLR